MKKGKESIEEDFEARKGCIIEHIMKDMKFHAVIDFVELGAKRMPLEIVSVQALTAMSHDLITSPTNTGYCLGFRSTQALS
jgi:hypothetical protein